MDEEGERKDEIRTDFCAERRIKLQFQGAGAHPWFLGRPDGLARGIYNRLNEDDRFSNKTIASEVQWCLNAMPAASGFSAYPMAFGPNPVDFLG